MASLGSLAGALFTSTCRYGLVDAEWKKAVIGDREVKQRAGTPSKGKPNRAMRRRIHARQRAKG